MNEIKYFDVCDELLDFQLSSSNCLKNRLSIEKKLHEIFLSYDNEKLYSMFYRVCDFYDKTNNSYEVYLFMFSFCYIVRNRRKKVYKQVLNNEKLVFSISEFYDYILFEYIVYNLENFKYNSDALFKKCGILSLEQKKIASLQKFMLDKVFKVRDDDIKYKGYVDVLRRLNTICENEKIIIEIKRYEQKKNLLQTSHGFDILKYLNCSKSKHDIFYRIEKIISEKPFCSENETSAFLFNEFNQQISLIFTRKEYVYKIVDYFIELEKLYEYKRERGISFCFDSGDFVIKLYDYAVKHNFDDCRDYIYSKVNTIQSSSLLGLKNTFLNYISNSNENSIFKELENKKKNKKLPLLNAFHNKQMLICSEQYKRENYSAFLKKVELSASFFKKINDGRVTLKLIQKLKTFFVRMKNNEIKRFGAIDYYTRDAYGTMMKFVLPFVDNIIEDNASNIFFYVQCKDNILYYTNPYDEFYIEDIENIITILYDESIKRIKIYMNGNVIFSKTSVYSFDIKDNFIVEYCEYVRNGLDDYLVTCLNLLDMSFDYRIKKFNEHNNQRKKLEISKYNYKLCLECSYSLEFIVFLDYIKANNFNYYLSNGKLTIDLDISNKLFFELAALYAYLYKENKINVAKIDEVDIKVIADMNECMHRLDFEQLIYLFINKASEKKDVLMNLDIYTQWIEDYSDSLELLNLVNLSKNYISLKLLDNTINISVTKITDIIDYYVAEEKKKGHFVRWKTEYQLYLLTKAFFSDAVYQFRSHFLGMQSLDIYIPSLSVGIEYQGIQHYAQTSYFGDLTKIQELDKRKKTICESNKINVVYWCYNIEINIENFKKVMSDNNIVVPVEVDNSYILSFNEFFERNNIKCKSEPRKVIAQYDLNGILISTFKSVREAASALGISDVAIHMAVTGKTLTAKNFIWRRYEIPEEIILDIIELPIELKKIRIYKANGDILDFENISMASQKLNIKKEILLSFLDAKNSVDEDNTIKCVKIIN